MRSHALTRAFLLRRLPRTPNFKWVFQKILIILTSNRNASSLCSRAGAHRLACLQWNYRCLRAHSECLSYARTVSSAGRLTVRTPVVTCIRHACDSEREFSRHSATCKGVASILTRIRLACKKERAFSWIFSCVRNSCAHSHAQLSWLTCAPRVRRTKASAFALNFYGDGL